MKKSITAIIIVSIISFLLLVYLATFLLTWQQMKVVKNFFTYLRGSNYSLAYDLTAAQFQESTSLEAFVDYSNSLELQETVDFKSMFRVPGRKLAKIYGELVYESYTIPLTVYLAKVADKWKIVTLKIKPSREQFKPKEPSATEISLLLQEALSDLIYGVKSGDFTDLHSALAVKLKEQLSAEVLAEQFADLEPLLKDLDLEAGDTLDIDLTKGMDENGILYLSGTYAVPQGILEFNFKYVFEEGKWRLVALAAS